MGRKGGLYICGMYYFLYVIIYLLSRLPFRVLYWVSDFFYFLIFYVIGYRKEVVINNLANAFPNKTVKERRRVMKDFYRNLTDTFVEAIKLLTISEKDLFRRCSSNLEVIEELILAGKNIQLHPGHQFNVEFYNQYYSARLKSIAFAFVYMPITNESMDKIFYKIRGRFGSVLIAATKFREEKKKFENRQYALTLGADQNPSYIQGAFWMNFFGKPAPFLPGPARSAVKSNTAIVLVEFIKIKRGYYQFKNTLLTKDPKEEMPEKLTRDYRDFIEQRVYAQPANYLWTHKRWKHEFKEGYHNLWTDTANLIH